VTRPQIVVNVAAALQRRGAPTDTGVAFMVFAGASGPSVVTECKSKADALAASVPDAIAGFVGDALNQGAPKVFVLRATAVDPAAVTEAEWKTALGKLGVGFGPGQVLIPGISTPAAYAALLAHADTFKARCCLLDTAKTATASAVATAAAGLASADGAERCTIVDGWDTQAGPGGTTRDVPASVIAAGLVGRNDAAVGHANNAPAGDQGRGAGYVKGSLGLAVARTDAEHDTLHDAGVSVFRNVRGQDQLYGWVSLSSDANFRQLNWGRMAMQLSTGIAAGAEQFLFRQIDGQGLLYGELEGMLRGYLAPLWSANALYGATADDAFDVDVAGVNSDATAQVGELHAAVAVSLTPHTEKVVIDVTTTIAEGVAS
jgi:hypothetical protein